MIMDVKETAELLCAINPILDKLQYRCNMSMGRKGFRQKPSSKHVCQRKRR